MLAYANIMVMKKFGLKTHGLPARILGVLATIGNFYFASANPHRFIRMMGIAGTTAQDREWRYLSRPLYRLQQKGHLSIDNKGGKVCISLTAKGRSMAEWAKIATLKMPTPPRWDGMWRIVIFDVPNTKNYNRLVFSKKLKEFGFRMIQRSVWAYPHECRKEINTLKKFYDIKKSVVYIEAKHIEGFSELP